MEQPNSKTRDNVPSSQENDATEPNENAAEVSPLQQGSLPEGGDFSSSQLVGGSKPDLVSTGPNVKGTIAGRN